MKKMFVPLTKLLYGYIVWLHTFTVFFEALRTCSVMNYMELKDMEELCEDYSKVHILCLTKKITA